MNKKTFIIAEIGINHNGSEKKAMKLIKIAKDVGANAVKFQTYVTSNLVIKNSKLANYQKKNSHFNNQFELLKKNQLSQNVFIKLKKYADKLGINFISSPFDLESAKFLIKRLGIKTIKIPSGEITNAPLLNYIGLNCKKILLSTGMSNMSDINLALDVLTHSLLKKKINNFNFINSYKKNKKKIKDMIILMHCNSEYPADLSNLNLNNIKTLKNYFNLNVGYSDHSKNIISSTTAVSLGANIIEKHLTINKNESGPDHSSSFNKEEFANMVNSIRIVENVLGKFDKEITREEKSNSYISRKSIIALKRIKKGEKFTNENITTKRPGKGISPIYFWNLLGKNSSRNYNFDDLIKENVKKRK